MKQIGQTNVSQKIDRIESAPFSHSSLIFLRMDQLFFVCFYTIYNVIYNIQCQVYHYSASFLLLSSAIHLHSHTQAMPGSKYIALTNTMISILTSFNLPPNAPPLLGFISRPVISSLPLVALFSFAAQRAISVPYPSTMSAPIPSLASNRMYSYVRVLQQSTVIKPRL